MDEFVQVFEMTAGHWHISYICSDDLVAMYTTVSKFNKTTTVIDRDYVYARFMGTRRHTPFIRMVNSEKFVEGSTEIPCLTKISVYLAKFKAGDARVGHDIGILPPILGPLNLHSTDPMINLIITR